MPALLRQLVWVLPDAVRPKPEPTVWVLAVSFDGVVVHDLQAPGRDFSMVTSVREIAGTLYLGSLHERAIAVCAVPGRAAR